MLELIALSVLLESMVSIARTHVQEMAIVMDMAVATAGSLVVACVAVKKGILVLTVPRSEKAVQ